MWLHLGPRPFVCHLASLWTLIISSAALLLLLRHSSHRLHPASSVCLSLFQRGCISCCSGCLHSPSICFLNAAFVSFSATHMCVNLLSPCLFPKRTHHWQCTATTQHEYSRRKLNECHPVEWLIIIWLRIWSTDTSSDNVLLSPWGVIFLKNIPLLCRNL